VLWTPRARRKFPKDWMNNGILTPIERLIYDAIDAGRCQKWLNPLRAKSLFGRSLGLRMQSIEEEG
jgi:hypothetical protein